MNREQKEQYKREYKKLYNFISATYHNGDKIIDTMVLNSIEKTAKMTVLKDTLLYKIKRFFISFSARKRQAKIEKNRRNN